MIELKFINGKLIEKILTIYSSDSGIENKINLLLVLRENCKQKQRKLNKIKSNFCRDLNFGKPNEAKSKKKYHTQNREKHKQQQIIITKKRR